MVRVLQAVSVLAGVGWMVAVCLGTAKSSDPLWALAVFRRLVSGDGALVLGLYLGWSVLLPLPGLECLVVTLSRAFRHHFIAGAATGVCAGIYLDYLQFAVPFAGEISNVPGLPLALMWNGDDRLAKIWAVGFCVNIAFYGAIGSVLGAAFGRRGSGVTDTQADQRKKILGTVRRVAGTVAVVVIVLIVALWGLGNGGAGVNAFLARFDVAPGVRSVRNITFDRPGGGALKLDLCRPEHTNDSRSPAIVCIHGGGWHGGKRSEYQALIVQLARRSYVAVTIDYRLAPAYRFPAQAEDVVAAVRWLRQHSDEYGVDPDRIGLLGWSAGGHLACFVGAAGGSMDPPSGDVQAVVSFSGLTDLTSDYWDVIPMSREALIGIAFDRDPAAHRAASPITHVHRNLPPYLLFHGAADRVVPLDQSQRFRDAIQGVGGIVSIRSVDDQGHRWFGSTLGDANREAFVFFDDYLKGSAVAIASGATEGGSG